MRKAAILATVLVMGPGLIACCGGPKPTGGAKKFDGESAFAYLEHLCRFGPRAPGTPGAREARAFMVKELKKWTPDVRELPFEGRDPPTGRSYDLVNIFARLHPEKPRRVMLVTHWDTRLWADRDPDPRNHNQPIIGANDGGSGVAVILELCRLFSARPPEVGVDVLFTDGEDLGRPGSHDYWQGSIRFAGSGTPFGKNKPAFAIVLDMVGDRDLKILRDVFSVKYAPDLVDGIWQTARDLGYEEHFPKEGRIAIKDDQIPLMEGLKIPSVLLIDFEYGPKHAYFHTVEDTLDKCSVRSLSVVGEVVASVIYGEKGE